MRQVVVVVVLVVVLVGVVEYPLLNVVEGSGSEVVESSPSKKIVNHFLLALIFSVTMACTSGSNGIGILQQTITEREGAFKGGVITLRI